MDFDEPSPAQQIDLSVGVDMEEFEIMSPSEAAGAMLASSSKAEAASLGDDGVDMKGQADFLSITVIGGSGDLAKKKIFPALFALYYEGHLPENFVIFGYARSKKTREEFCDDICFNLTCRVDESDKCGPKLETFLEKCYYQSGGYDSLEGFGALSEQLSLLEGDHKSNRLFYFSIPPNVFVDAAQGASRAASSTTGWNRVIVEKPFGRDLASSRALSDGLYRNLTEDQIYRIDHYLGKELVENLSVLRFSNLVFQPLWTRQCIRNVQIIFSEDFGTEGRGGYFDNYGIIRDIMQNHLLQILALFAMEQPVSLDAEDMRDEKVKLLRSIKPIKMDNVVIGQYKGSKTPEGKNVPGYLDDEGVPSHSLTPTFSAIALFIDNPRWDGVPFLMVSRFLRIDVNRLPSPPPSPSVDLSPESDSGTKSGLTTTIMLSPPPSPVCMSLRELPPVDAVMYQKAGKALTERKAEVRVQFRHVPGNLYKTHFGTNIDMATNELVIRLQPDSGVYLRINNKVPGIGLRLDRTNLDLIYKTKYTTELPDAYERLIIDAINGDKRLFIRNDELDHAWRLFTPILDKLEQTKQVPELYPYGSRGPLGAHYLAAKYGVRWGDLVE